MTTRSSAREMVRLAREAWSTWVPDRPLPDAAAGDEEAENAIVRPVLDAIAGEHRQPAELLDWCTGGGAPHRGRSAATRTSSACADEPLKITWTPVFMRAYGRAFLDSPGPLDKGQLEPLLDHAAGREHWAPRRPSRTCARTTTGCCACSASTRACPATTSSWPASNRSPSLTRTIFTSGMFAEGWAVYVTQVMMDLGYGDHEPALLLNHWKFYLRAVDQRDPRRGDPRRRHDRGGRPWT